MSATGATKFWLTCMLWSRMISWGKKKSIESIGASSTRQNRYLIQFCKVLMILLWIYSYCNPTCQSDGFSNSELTGVNCCHLWKWLRPFDLIWSHDISCQNSFLMFSHRLQQAELQRQRSWRLHMAELRRQEGPIMRNHNQDRHQPDTWNFFRGVMIWIQQKVSFLR